MRAIKNYDPRLLLLFFIVDREKSDLRGRQDTQGRNSFSSQHITYSDERIGVKESSYGE